MGRQLLQICRGQRGCGKDSRGNKKTIQEYNTCKGFKSPFFYSITKLKGYHISFPVRFGSFIKPKKLSS